MIGMSVRRCVIRSTQDPGLIKGLDFEVKQTMVGDQAWIRATHITLSRWSVCSPLMARG